MDSQTGIDATMEARLHEVPLRVLFSIRYLHVEEALWDFYINYVPELGGQDLESAFGGGNDQPILLASNTWLLSSARPLINEMRSLVPQHPAISVGGIPVAVAGGFWAFSHYINGWSQSDPAQIEWVKDLRLPNGNPVKQDTQGKIDVSGLSNAARAALARLDGFAIVTARERFAAKVSGAALFPPGVSVLPRRTKVFISYRRSQIETAKALHHLLVHYGNGAIFEPYLDLHDLDLGSLRAQLKERITDWADLFMPLVSDDYAATGTISAMELEWARRMAEGTDSASAFIAPIFIADPETAVARDLGDLVRGHIPTAADVAPDNEGLRNFLVSCARG